MAEACDPVLAVMGGGPKHGVRKAGFTEPLELRIAAEFFDAKIGRINGVGVDQNRWNTGAPEHCRSSGTGEAASDDCNVRISHGRASARNPIIAPQKANKSFILMRL